jgi:hypothetical protein
MIIVNQGKSGAASSPVNFSTVLYKIPGMHLTSYYLLVRRILDGREIGYDEVWQIETKETSCFHNYI